MTTKYEIRFKGNEAWLEVVYHEGNLIKATIINQEHLSPTQINYVWTALVNSIKIEWEMHFFIKTSNGKLRYQELPFDTSFDAFWTQYANKVGKKERTTQLWKLLSDEDKSRALAGIKRYKNWLLQNPSVQMLYPETYISQKRWENEY